MTLLQVICGLGPLPPMKNSGYAYGTAFYFVIVIVITSCIGQETAEGPFGLRVKLPPAHRLPHTPKNSHCPFNCLTSSKETVNTNFLVFGLTQLGIVPEPTTSVAFIVVTSFNTQSARNPYSTLFLI